MSLVQAPVRTVGSAEELLSDWSRNKVIAKFPSYTEGRNLNPPLKYM